jgi:predicted metal-dependent hydrolase
MSPREESRLLAGRRLRYLVRRSPRARRLSVSVSRRKGLEVVLPRGATRADLEKFFTEAATWLALQVERHGVWDGPVRRSYATGSTLRVLGQDVRLVLSVLPLGRVRPTSEFNGDILHLALPAPEILDPRPALERWLRRFAADHLRRRADDLAERTGLRPSRVVVGDRVTRWGSCSRTGTISFCYRLVMAAPAVVDAVVVHELCHLRHHDHGPRFQRLVNLLCPDHDPQMAWLREHGEELDL